MKCPSCGHNLKIEDEKCPFCGNLNPYAKSYRKDMHYYINEFQRIKQKTLDRNKQFNAFFVKIILICILLIILLLIIIGNQKAFEIGNNILDMKLTNNLSISQNMENYEKNRDYIALADYYDSNSLAYVDLYNEYEAVFYISYYYTNIYKYIHYLYSYDELNLKEDYMVDRELVIHGIAQAIYDVYDSFREEHYEDSLALSEKHKSYMYDCLKDMEDMLKVYCHFSDDEITSLRESTESRVEVLLEEAILRDE